MVIVRFIGPFLLSTRRNHVVQHQIFIREESDFISHKAYPLIHVDVVAS